MKKNFLITCVFFLLALSVNGQKRNYNCVILDSILNTLEFKKAQNDFLLPLFRSGEIKTNGDTIFRVTTDARKSRQIDSVIKTVNIKERNWFLNDTLFSLDTFNVVVDTFGFFDKTCKSSRYLVVNDHRIVSKLKKACNTIIVEQIAYTRNGSISIALRNTKSHYAIIVGIRQQALLYPSVSVIGKHLFDPESGLIIE